MPQIVFTELYELVLNCYGSFSYIFAGGEKMTYDKDKDCTQHYNVVCITKGRK